MSDFFHMGGYALWVWGAYGFALLVILAMIAAALHLARARRRAVAALDGEHRRAVAALDGERRRRGEVWGKA